MGRYPRRRQRRLGEKLRQIRDALGLSQSQIVHRLGSADEFTRTNISNYEQDEREPPLFVLLEYARLAGICLDVLVDDKLDLPRVIPSTPLHHPTPTRSTKRVTKKR
jgi:transcriptional regulator with XRE-family HTH domain